jgi:ubiquinone/menaquinone biosynthesis C-methylase UbiE
MGSSATQGELWGAAAQDWAELQEPLHKPVWQAMLDAAKVGQGTRFLDAGCGGGGASVLAAQRGAHVSGLDASEALIAIARERVPQGDFRVGDLEALPYGENAFDAVIAALSVQYADDPIAALRELKPSLRPKAIWLSAHGAYRNTASNASFSKLCEISCPHRLLAAGPLHFQHLAHWKVLLSERIGKCLEAVK